MENIFVIKIVGKNLKAHQKKTKKINQVSAILNGPSMTIPDTFKEKRKHPRLEKNIPVKLSYEDADIVTETRNISRTGAYCRVNKYVEPMTKLKIHLLIPTSKGGKITTKKVSCQGIVVRTESIPGSEDFNIAVYFRDIQEREAEYISDYVNSCLAKKKV